MFKLLRFEDGIEAFEIILNPEGMDVCFLMIPTLISIGHCVEQLLWRRRELPDSLFLLEGQKTVSLRKSDPELLMSTKAP